MPDFRLWGSEPPHPGQARVWREWERIAAGEIDSVFLACGPRWGKDRLSVWLVLAVALRLLSMRGNSTLIPRVHAWIVAPSRTLYQQIWTEYKAYTKGLPRSVNESSHRISLGGSADSGGALLEFKSGWDADQLDGVGLDILHVTEAAGLSNEAWQDHLVHRLASPGRLGFSVINGTPTVAPADWYVQRWEEVERSDRGILVNEPSWANPHLTRRQVEAIDAARDGGIPRRKYDATFAALLVPDAGGVFRGVREACTASPGPRGQHVSFYDPSGRGLDFHAVSTFDVDTPTQVYADHWGTVGWEITRSRLARLREYPGELWVDTTGDTEDAPLLASIREAVGPGVAVRGYKFNNANKEAMVDNLAIGFETGTVALLDPEKCKGEMRAAAETQRRELERLRPHQLPSGLIRYAAPEGQHDDAAIACMASALLSKDTSGDATAVLKEMGALF